MNTHTHPRSGDTISVPDNWEILGADCDADTLIAIEPASDDGFRFNVVLSVVDNGGLELGAWQQASEEDFEQMLADYQCLDICPATIDSHPGGQRLARYITNDGWAVTMQQWFVDLDGTGHTLTITVDDSRFAETLELAADIAARWRLGASR